MAEKTFYGLDGKFSDPAVAEDFETAERIDKLWVGSLGVYYRDGFRTRCIRYDQMERAFIRIQAVRGRMCCGQANFEYSRMVFVCGGKEYADVMTEDNKAMDRALEAIAAKAPNVKIGFVKEE